MTEVQFVTILEKTLILILELSAPILIVCLVVGLVISIFQSVTQIQEPTIAYVPKIIAGFITLIVLAPWMIGVYINTINDIFASVPYIIH